MKDGAFAEIVNGFQRLTVFFIKLHLRWLDQYYTSSNFSKTENTTFRMSETQVEYISNKDAVPLINEGKVSIISFARSSP